MMDETIKKKLNNLDYSDMVQFGNIAQMINQDMKVTSEHGKQIKDGKWIEHNPIVRQFADNPNAVGTYGMLAAGLLGNRWAGMENSNQRKIEMLLAQMAQAGALQSWGKPWKIQYGIEF